MVVAKRPNFLIIVADDLGFSDVKPYGSEIDTPVLDRLSKDGIRMTNFHTAQACSPTRAMLLSGTDNHIAGLGQMAEFAEMKKNLTGKYPDYVDKPGYEGYLNWRVAALPEILSDAGYLTLMSGKWHLGMTPDVSPSARGFKKSFGFLPGCGNHFNYEPQFEADQDTMLLTSDGFWMENQSPVDRKKDLPGDFYSTNFFTGGKYDNGPDQLRLDRLAKLKELGLVPSDVEAAPPVGFEAGVKWEDLTDHERAVSARKMEVYAAMVDLLDQNIGRVVDALEASGELDNTFILFMSDNGAEGSTLEAAPLLSSFKTLGELIAAHYDNSLENIGKHDSYVWYGSRWACAATAPSRGFKGWSTEGGIRCPCLIRFPPISSAPQTISHTFTTVMDILPTILDLAQVQHPGKTFRGREVVNPRGKSWVGHLSSPTEYPNVHQDADHIHGWELFGNRAIRRGNWKAVLLAKQGGDNWELFDVEKDPAEQHDLSKKRPEVLEEMLVHWATYVAETGTQSPRNKALVPSIDITHFQRIAPSPTEGLAAHDRELLCHWHQISHKAIVHQRGSEDLFQHEVIHLAFDHPVILNLILAISSFEQAHTAHHSQVNVPGYRIRRDIYASLGLKYSQAAARMMRHAVAKANIDNGLVCHLASILMMINSYAQGSVKELVRVKNEPSTMLSDLLVTCRLTRGVRAISDAYGVIRPDRHELILYVTEAEPPDRGPLDPILQMLNSLTFLEEEKDPVTKQICQDALDLMKWLVKKAQTSEWCPAHRASLQWICLVGKEFMRLAEAHEPAALVLLSYGCFLDSGNDSNTFVMRGWKEGVCAEIRNIVGSEWAKAILL
ncbi:putative sulfatase PB10D8.02c [Fusarium oxysporum f. sp. narcissi]|uniref:Putative sulfatase PB10D8.02c n=1 Tax=Fusarium oxysporum f. sp. narcissi TaxID=451672 RepID=A0A4Q2V579_FUSOX|nr:putative sulfatase PB10D8.02c [Fusarium oxysporum f. sp. narcissi]